MRKRGFVVHRQKKGQVAVDAATPCAAAKRVIGLNYGHHWEEVESGGVKVVRDDGTEFWCEMVEHG